MSRVDDIRGRVEAATPGPWFRFIDDAYEDGPAHIVHTAPGDTVALTGHGPRDGSASRDAALIANAPADLAYLLAENEKWQGAALEATAGESIADAKVAALLDRVDELREQVGIEVRAKDEWEENAIQAEDGRDKALAAHDRVWEDRQRSDRLLAEARGLLDADKAEIVAEMDKVRERNRVQWEEARAERAERIAEHEAEVARLRAQVDTVRKIADKWEKYGQFETPHERQQGWTHAARQVARQLRAALNQGGETNGE